MRTWIIISALFFTSSLLHCQTIYSLAGMGLAGNSGDGGPALNASLNNPVGIVVDPSGNIYFTDEICSCVRKIDATGIINTIAGIPGSQGLSGDGGPATSAKLNNPTGIAFDPASGSLIVADEGNLLIRKISSTGTITTIAGAGTSTIDGILASNSKIGVPTSVLVDQLGNIYFTDNCRVRKINTSGIISTVAGNGTYGNSGDGSLATSAQLFGPTAIALDSGNNLYIADGYNNCVRKVNTTGTISTIAGNGTGGYSGDGFSAISAELNGPTGIAADANGNIYISDNDRVIRRINSSGIISTISGTIVVAGYNGSGIPASSAMLNFPRHLFIDSSNNLYFCDRDNHRVRVICVTNCLAGIEEKAELKTIQVSPNPVSDKLTISGSILFETESQVEIINSIGQTVLKLNYTGEIDVSELSQGYYILKITDQQKRQFHSRFLKQ